VMGLRPHICTEVIPLAQRQATMHYRSTSRNTEEAHLAGIRHQREQDDMAYALQIYISPTLCPMVYMNVVSGLSGTKCLIPTLLLSIIRLRRLTRIFDGLLITSQLRKIFFDILS
jgi:hypothetical protein